MCLMGLVILVGLVVFNSMMNLLLLSWVMMLLLCSVFVNVLVNVLSV